MTRRAAATLLAAVLISQALALTGGQWRVLWPPVAAVAVIAATRQALAGLLAGAYAGALLLAGGDPWSAYTGLFSDHLAPSLQSSWKTGAVAFTVILGGFAAVLESGGGLGALLRRMAGGGGDRARRLETAAAALGLLCFFDGLANSMVVGRVSRDLGDRCGVSRVKLAYIVDSTSSAVACVALVSTWIAFQLSMIAEAYALAGTPANPYAVFLASLPYNFHCWFTLVLLFASIGWRYHPGPMGRYAPHPPQERAAAAPERHPAAALAPLAVLLAAIFLGFVYLGGDGAARWSRDGVVAAFGSDAGPQVLVLAGLAAGATAVALNRGPRGWIDPLRAWGRGAGAMFGPVLILAAAWMLGSVVSELGTARLLSDLLLGRGSLFLLPTLTFVAGAMISFATGTSWGTMGLLFPLAVPAAAAAGAGPQLLPVIVAAVFSGAVFGDHCSPFSDTTIVTSIACGVEPHDHVRTQLPYALIAAFAAVLLGFLPAGLGAPAWSGLLAGTLALTALARFGGRRRAGGRP